MTKLLIISFDAVGDDVFPQLCERPHFSDLASKAALRRQVDSVFLTNTYPVHTSVATGQPPSRHRLISNTQPFPVRHPQWCYREKDIQSPTLWQVAARHRLTTAAVMWPVTGHSRTIRYNIPELAALPGENQVLLNLRYGSKWLQLVSFLRHRHLLDGISQPARDRFATACMADILRRKKPDLALMHLTAYDSLCHEHGVNAPQLQKALDAMDENLGLLLDAAGNTDVILFSDHAQLPAETPILPNDWLVQQGWMQRDSLGNYVQSTPPGCYFECCGGSGFFYPGSLGPDDIAAAEQMAQQTPGVARLLTAQEMATCGRAHLPFGFAAKPGYAVHAYDTGEKANHGYPLDYQHYHVFWLHAGPSAQPGESNGGSLLDIAPLAAQILGFPKEELA